MRTIITAIGLIVWASSASATTVQIDATNLGGSSWQFEYTVINDTLSFDIVEFTIYFDYTLYANLGAVADMPAGWDTIAIQPDPGLPDDGFLDSLALGAGIAPGASQSGFTITFDYLGIGIPDDQLFQVVDPVTFAVLDEGTTTITNVIPLPGAIWLMLSALIVCGRGVSRRVPSS